MSEHKEPCTERELDLLRDERRTSRNGIIAAYILVIVAAAVMPWIGSARTHGKAMVDAMSFPAAFISIALVGSLIIWFYYFRTIRKIRKDLREREKVVGAGRITKKYDKITKRISKFNYKEVPGTYADIDGPVAFKYFQLTPEEFKNINEGDPVEVEFFPNSKKIIRIHKKPV